MQEKPTVNANRAIFIEGTNKLSHDMRDRILSLTDSAISNHLDNDKDIERCLAGSELVFSYGSNMSKKQMLKRAPSAELLSIGMLENYKLVFNRQGSYRPGGVASIEAQVGSRVYGGVWKVSGSQLDAMDKAEDPDAYSRQTITIKGLDGTDYICHVYIAHEQGSFLPDAAYLQLIVSSAKDLELPIEYINELVALESNQDE